MERAPAHQAAVLGDLQEGIEGHQRVLTLEPLPIDTIRGHLFVCAALLPALGIARCLDHSAPRQGCRVFSEVLLRTPSRGSVECHQKGKDEGTGVEEE